MIIGNSLFLENKPVNKVFRFYNVLPLASLANAPRVFRVETTCITLNEGNDRNEYDMVIIRQNSDFDSQLLIC